MNTGRVIILLLDSFGIGESLDAGEYNDKGANTFLSIYNACKALNADRKGVRQGELTIPHLTRLGLMHATVASSAREFIDLGELPNPDGYFGYAVEQSLGKDTPSGHWEIAGVPVEFKWGYFEEKIPCFPEELINELIHRAKLAGVLGNKHASGTQIIAELGQEHILSNKPIVYTSADSVFQIAAHEQYFGLQRLYEVSLIARELVDKYKIGRVIARPFIGEAQKFTRTTNRRDYSIPPPELTLLDYLKMAGHDVIAVGKVADIFAHQGVTHNIKAGDNMDIFDKTLEALQHAKDGSLIFSNFVDFDSSYGHRRDVIGYANALEEFDKRIPEIEAQLNPKDIVIITADHGCDPTFPGTDHTREHIPILAFGKELTSKFIGRRDTFADIGQSIADKLQINPLSRGVSFFYD